MATVEDRRLTIPEDIYESLTRAKDSERKRNVNSPLIAEMITEKSLAQHILRNWVQKYGYWEPKEKSGS